MCIDRYQDAARLRDELKDMQASMDSQQAEEESWRSGLPQERHFRLGQRVTHTSGFQASIVGCAIALSKRVVDVHEL